MDWFKKHVDTVVILAGILGCFLWINGKFEDVDRRLNGKFEDVDRRLNGKFEDVDRKLSDIDKRLVRIETVLIMKNIMPMEMASNQDPHIKDHL